MSHPLTILSQQEHDFKQSIRDFSEKEIKPIVRLMDKDSQIQPQLIKKLFELGVMGIEIPEKYGGCESSFTIACLAVEE